MAAQIRSQSNLFAFVLHCRIHAPHLADDNRRMELVPPRAPGEDDVNFRALPGSVSNEDGARGRLSGVG